MAYRDDLNLFVATNPDETGVPNPGVAPVRLADADPLIAAPLPGGPTPAPPPYQGLTGDPYQTAIVASAQLAALTPRPKRRPAPAASAPAAAPPGLSRYLGG